MLFVNTGRGSFLILKVHHNTTKCCQAFMNPQRCDDATPPHGLQHGCVLRDFGTLLVEGFVGYFIFCRSNIHRSIFGKTGQIQLPRRKDLKSFVFSIATYGSESWVLKTTDKKKMKSFELWCYRRLLRIKWTDKQTNEYVLSKIATSERLLTTIVKRKMAFVGHVFRKGDIAKTY